MQRTRNVTHEIRDKDERSLQQSYNEKILAFRICIRDLVTHLCNARIDVLARKCDSAEVHETRSGPDVGFACRHSSILIRRVGAPLTGSATVARAMPAIHNTVPVPCSASSGTRCLSERPTRRSTNSFFNFFDPPSRRILSPARHPRNTSG